MSESDKKIACYTFYALGFIFLPILVEAFWGAVCLAPDNRVQKNNPLHTVTVTVTVYLF
jgi:hypothetical protein